MQDTLILTKIRPLVVRSNLLYCAGLWREPEAKTQLADHGTGGVARIGASARWATNNSTSKTAARPTCIVA